MARKELYRYRHAQEVAARVAREEAQAVGAYFGLGPVEVGDILEDKAYENWKEWAVKEIQALKAREVGAYSGVEEEAQSELAEPLAGDQLTTIEGSIPNTKDGTSAMGGAVVRP